MKKIAIITNIPSPYRVDLFYYMQTHFPEFEFHILYTGKHEDNRQWTIQEQKLLNSLFLQSKIWKIKGKLDDRYIHFPANTGRVLSQIKPEVVIAAGYSLAALQASAWCKLKKKRYITWTDGTLFSERNISTLQKLFRRIIIEGADAGIASSTKSKENLQHWRLQEEITFLSLLTEDITHLKSLENQSISGRLLYVGSMIERKGLDLLINALPLMEESWNLHIVGNGTQEQIDALKHMAQEKGILNRITWCGFLEGDALLAEYAQASAFVLPTREDCYGLVLVEAFCAKLPIVTSKYADGAYDIVTKENGIIVDPYCPEELAAALDKVLSDVNFADAAQHNDCERFEFRNTSQGIINAIKYVERS